MVIVLTERGRWIEIATANEDASVFSVPKNKIAEITKVEVRNPTASDARIRIWDKFTDTEGTSQTIQKFDHTVVAGDSIIADVEEAKQLLGDVVAQSTIVTVQIYVGVKLK